MTKRGKSTGSGIASELKLSQQLVMTPQLQMAIRLLATPTAELPQVLAEWHREHPDAVVALADGELDPADAEERANADEDSPPPLVALDDPPLPPDPSGRIPDIWVVGNPPEAHANRAALLRVRVAKDQPIEHVRAAQWLVRSLRQRLRTFKTVVQHAATLRPELATAAQPGDIKPVKKRELAEAVGMHESTIARVAKACVVQTRRTLFVLEAVVR